MKKRNETKGRRTKWRKGAWKWKKTEGRGKEVGQSMKGEQEEE